MTFVGAKGNPVLKFSILLLYLAMATKPIYNILCMTNSCFLLHLQTYICVRVVDIHV